MLRKLKLLFAVLMILAKSSFAQTNNDQIEFTFVEGIKSFTPNKYSIQGTLLGGELGYHFNMADNKADYIRMLNISAIDIVASYRNLQSLTIDNDLTSMGSLGDAYSVIARLEIPLLKGGPVKLLFTPGFGLAWSTLNYLDNKNLLVGSHLNMATQAGVKFFIAITSSTGIQAGADLFHYSNGGSRVPNYGINSFNISLGIVQGINQPGPSTQHPLQYEHKGSLEFGGDIGARGVFESKKELYRSGLYAGYSYRLIPIINLKGGFDAGYYFTVYDPNNSANTFESHATSYDKWRTGISLGADIWLGRFAVMGCYGYYIHFNSYYHNKTYWAPGLKYQVLPWMALQAKSYIHSHEADYLGFGLLFCVH